MPTTAYYLTIETRDRYDATEYAESIAGRLAHALQTTLQDTHKLAALTNCTSLSNPRIEVEVAQSERPQAPDYKSAVVARAILMTTHPPGKLYFSKNKFTHHMRNALREIPISVKKQCGESDAEHDKWNALKEGKSAVTMPIGPRETDSSD